MLTSSQRDILHGTRMSLKAITLPWMAALLLQGSLAIVLAAKKMWKKFPLFLSYCVSNLVLNIVLYVIHASKWQRSIYFEAYWLTEAVGLFLGVAVVYEIFNHLLTPYPALRKLAGQIFQGVIIVLALLACIVVYSQPSGDKNHMQAAFLLVEQVCRIIEVGLLLFLFVFASAFGLHWRQYAFGIAVGLGIFATVELVALTMRIQFGTTANSVFNIVRTFSFNSSLLIWIGYILAPELAARPAEVPKRAQLEQWNKAIMELIYQ